VNKGRKRKKLNSTAHNRKISVVVTSIFDGKFLTYYTKKASEERVVSRTKIIVIPDKKTPSTLYQKCEILKDMGYDIVCPTIEEQDGLLKKLGNIINIVPYNSDNRRNIGYLMAYESGDEILISIDDDNFPIEKVPYFKQHDIVASGKLKHSTIRTKNGWLNNCSLLNFKNSYTAYPRGFPYYARFKDETKKAKKLGANLEIHINAGLWLKDPDVDAITWLSLMPKVTSFKETSVVLAENTWTPINTQNTALNRVVIPSYWFVKMGYRISGLSIDRYGDIFSGYFAQACAKHLGFGIRVGHPVVNHIRNSHNYIKDINQELACIVVLEDILKWLTEVKLDGSTYSEAYLSLASQMEDAVEKFEGFVWNDATRGYFHHIAYCMRIWIDTIKTIDGTK
jgi:hypothetical protein